MRVVLVTGISGSGKSVAVNVLEDDGFFCIDNLPARFLQDVIDSLQAQGYQRVAVSIDARSGAPIEQLGAIVAGLSAAGHDVKVLFLNARTDTLVQRYSETRRRHPLASLQGPADGATATLIESIDRERELMSAIEGIGLSIDTSDLHPNLLRHWVRDVVELERAPLTLLFESFAFKYGVPLDADLVFDVRCLPNPHYEVGLAPLTGRDQPVIEFLERIPAVEDMYGDIHGFVSRWLPAFVRDNRNYLTVAIGCTGGQHRSVYFVERLAAAFEGRYQVQKRHREIRGTPPASIG